MPQLAVVSLVSCAPYSQARNYDQEVERLPRETPDAYEARTWRHKCHTMADGRIFIQPMAFKMGLDSAAKMLGRQIPGKGKSTYSKFFLSGVLVMDPVVLPVKASEVPMDRLYVNSDGIRGSGRRVWKNFPRIDAWAADVPYHVLADEITRDVFEEHVRQAGAFIGIGRFRPQSGGFYGRYEVKEVRWR